MAEPRKFLAVNIRPPLFLIYDEEHDEAPIAGRLDEPQGAENARPDGRREPPAP